MTKEFWDERYSNPEYVYGEEPNVYFRDQLKKFTTGSILLPAEGEGRNAVFAARSGWKVFAFDQSEQGRYKALQLAEKNHVMIDYRTGELSSVSYPTNSFNAIALIYAHFPFSIRTAYHRKLADFLKQGGTVILEAFSKKHYECQLHNPQAGGPKDITMLFSLDDIKEDFPDFQILDLKEEEIDLSEGMFHSGRAWVIRFTGQKK